MVRFSSSGTVEPSNMCDWKVGCRPAATSSASRASSGRTRLSRFSLTQWSVCRATVTP